MAEFKAGDIVMVKSGSPALTVDHLDTNSKGDVAGVWCVWFAGAKHERARFAPGTLQPWEEKKK